MYASDARKLNRLRRLYWNFLWNHPAHVPLPPRAIPDATDALTWYYTENLVSGSRSYAPFSKTECEELFRVLREVNMPSSDNSVAKAVFLAWLLREVCSFRDAEYYGMYVSKDAQALRQARISRNVSPHDRPPRILLPFLRIVTNVFFFGIPHSYYTHVKFTSEYRGRLASVQLNWEKYIERLVREYSHFLLISTVLLSATVGFLTVSNVSEGSRIAAIASAMTSLGSIIVGVFSIWRHQASTHTTESFIYMHNAQHNFLGYHGHALLLSLPPTLLVWAIITFILAIIIYVMQDITAVDSWKRTPAWLILALFIILLITVIAALYTFSIIWKFQRRASRVWYHIGNFWRGRFATSSTDLS